MSDAQDKLKRTMRLWAARACGYDDADDFGDGSPEDWTLVLAAVDEYARAVMIEHAPDSAFCTLAELRVLAAKAAVCDAYLEWIASPSAPAGNSADPGDVPEDWAPFRKALAALRKLQQTSR